jgi:pyridoxal/pyridoxine/pyridoxamine kinase
MLKPAIVEERIHTNPSEFPAWTEVGRVGSRVHIPFHPDRMDEALDNVGACLMVRDAAIRGYLKSEEAMKTVMAEVKRIGAKK